MMRTLGTLLCLLLLGAGSSFAADKHGKQAYLGSKAFERLKTLAGVWECEMDMGNGPMKMKSVYKLSAGGSAVVETALAGTPMEMVTIYHDDSKKRLTMTHYCMLHNQPKLVLKKYADNKLSMNLAKNSDIDVEKEHHMHSMILTFKGPDKIVQTWTNFKGGKAEQSMDMEFRRVK